MCKNYECWKNQAGSQHQRKMPLPNAYMEPRFLKKTTVLISARERELHCEACLSLKEGWFIQLLV